MIPGRVIERGLARAGSESYTLESFYRRRDRKRARTRFTAGVVGLAIAITVAIVGSAILRSAPENKDVGRNAPGILRDGEVLQVVDQFGDSATFVATDLGTGSQRLIHGCVVASGDPDCGYIDEFALSAEGGWIAWEQGCTGGGTESCTSGLWVADADGSPGPGDVLGRHGSPGLDLGLVTREGATRIRDPTLGLSGARSARPRNRRKNECPNGHGDLFPVVVAGREQHRGRIAVLRCLRGRPPYRWHDGDRPGGSRRGGFMLARWNASRAR